MDKRDTSSSTNPEKLSSLPCSPRNNETLIKESLSSCSARRSPPVAFGRSLSRPRTAIQTARASSTPTEAPRTPRSHAPRKLASQDDARKREEKAKSEPRSQIPKQIGRVNTAESVWPGGNKPNRVSSIQSQIARSSVTPLDRKTIILRAEQNHTITPKPRAVNTMTNSEASKLAAKQKSSLLRSKKNTTVLKFKSSKDVENSQNLTQENVIKDCNQSFKKDNFIHLKNDVLRKKKEFLDSYNNFKSSAGLMGSELKEMEDMLEIVKLQKLDPNKADHINIPLLSEYNESGAGETTQNVMSTEDTSELVRNLTTRICSVPSSSMDLCRKMLLQKEKLICDCLSKINTISQYNFEIIGNELKETLTSHNGEDNQLASKLDILEGQQNEVLGSLVSDITDLIEEKSKLLDKKKRLAITQDKHNAELQYKIDLLIIENTNVTKKLTKTADIYEKEKKIYDQTIIQTRRMLLNANSALNAQEKKIAALESQSKMLQNTTKLIEHQQKKERQKNKNITSKSQGYTQEIQEIKAQLENERAEKLQIEEKMQSLNTRLEELEIQLEEEKTQKCAAKKELEDLLCLYSKLRQSHEESREQLETYNKSVQSDYLQNKEYTEMVDNYNQKMEAKDGEIKTLKNQINKLNERVEKMTNDLDYEGEQKAEYFEEARRLNIQLRDLSHTLQNISREKEELEKINIEMTLELEQREHVIHLHTRAKSLRDEINDLLETNDENDEENVNKLGVALINKEESLEMYEKSFSYQPERQSEIGNSDYSFETNESFGFGSNAITEYYSLLEQKHIMVKKLEKRVKELEAIYEKTEHERIRHEARINQLEHALSEKCLTNPGLIPILLQ